VTTAPASHPEYAQLRVESDVSVPLAVIDVEASDALPPATPEALLLGDLRHPQLRLRAPISLVVEQEDKFVGIWYEPLEQMGCGEHLTAAVEDFQQTLSELYFTLRDDQDHLGAELARQWELLQSLVEERP
jgi:hypothetical protein